MRKTILLIVVLSLVMLAGCQSGTTQKANVKIMSAKRVDTHLMEDTVYLNLKNKGGEGKFKLKAYVYAEEYNVLYTVSDESEPIQVDEGWQSDMEWKAYTTDSRKLIRKVEVLTKGIGDTEYKVTDSREF